MITNASIIMKCDRLVPISSQDPTFVTKYKNCNTIISENIKTIQKILKIFSLPTEFIARKAQHVNINGTISFNKIRPIILNGLKTVRKALTHIGSNEFKLAIFPQPKNPTNINTMKRNALRNDSV